MEFTEILEWHGHHFILFLRAKLNRPETFRTSFLRDFRLGMPSQGYYYSGQGSISRDSRIEQFFFKTALTEKETSFDVLMPAPFRALCETSRDQILVFLETERHRAPIIDAMCEEKLAVIQNWLEQKRQLGIPPHRILLPEIEFGPLSMDFLARHLFGKVPLTFPA